MKSKTQIFSRSRLHSPHPWLFGASLTLAAIACGGSELEHKDLGNTSASLSPSDRTQLVDYPDTCPDKPCVVVDPVVVGHWVGEAEDLFSAPGPDGSRRPYTFPSGSTRITLDLSLTALSPRQELNVPPGAIVFGEGPVPAPEAGVIYPPGIHPEQGTDLAAAPPVEGFAYTLFGPPGATPAGGAFAIAYQASESYQDWCPLQPSQNETGQYDCITPGPFPGLPLPATGWCADDPPSTREYDCRFKLVCQACDCSATGCTAGYGGGFVTLLLTRSGDDLLGTFVRLLFDYGPDSSYLPVGSIRFKRELP